MEIIDCKGWNAVPRNNSDLPKSAAKGIVIHHTAGQNIDVPPDQARPHARQLARAIQQDHMMRNGWRDSGQHFLVTRAGIALEGRCGSLAAAERGLVIQGAHAGDNDANHTRWGIENEGTYSEADLTPEHWAALVELCAQLCVWGRVDSAEIKPHRDFKPTECCGDRLVSKLDDLRAAVHARKLEIMGKET